jgi:hypothetical protein
MHVYLFNQQVNDNNYTYVYAPIFYETNTKKTVGLWEISKKIGPKGIILCSFSRAKDIYINRKYKKVLQCAFKILTQDCSDFTIRQKYIYRIN